MRTTHSARSLVGRTLGICSVIALGAWILLLRPQLLGGPAAYIIVSGVSMEPALHEGTLVIATRQSSYSLGDVIVYRVPAGDVAAGSDVIHRIVGGAATDGYVVQGDNTNAPDRWRPLVGDVIGREVIAIPAVGPAIGLLRSPLLVALAATTLVVWWLLGGSRRAGPTPASAPSAGPATAPASRLDRAS